MPASNTIVVRRDELYEQIWASPLRKVAAQYYISDVALRKVCRRLKIPVPYRGYWAKLAHGHKTTKTPLPVTPEGIPETHSFRLRGSLVKPPGDVASEKALITPLAREVGVGYPRVEQITHRATRAAMKSASSGSLDLYGRVLLRGNGLPSISVSPDHLERAMLAYEALIGLAVLAGFTFVFGETCKSAAHFLMSDERIDIRISEELKRERRRLRKADYMGRTHESLFFLTGRLKISIEVPNVGLGKRQWIESDTHDIQDSVLPVVRKMYEAPQRIKLERKRCELLLTEWDHERKNRELGEHLAAVDRQQRAELIRQAHEWQETQMVRRYVAEVRRHVDGRDLPSTDRAQVEQWLHWAGRQADELDPLRKDSALIQARNF